MAAQQGAQHHDPALFGEEGAFGRAGGVEDEPGEALEGEDLKAREAGKRRVGKDLALQLKGRLFWGEHHQGRAFGIVAQAGANFLQAAAGFAASSRA